MKLQVLPFLFFALISVQAFAQDEVDDSNIDVLLGKLRNLSIFIDTDSDRMIEQQQEKIKLADKILEHPDMEEAHRVFATISRIQALGIHFNVLYREKKQDTKLNKIYAEAIEDGLDDEDQRIVIESTTSAASYNSGLYVLDPDEETAEAASDAIEELRELGPKDPLIQATRRLLLEQLWKSDQPKLVFEAVSNEDEKLAKIVLDQIKEATDLEKANFLWAKYFSRFGDFVAQRRLADMYEVGKGTTINYSQAARWYTKLARLGDRFAQVKLGDFYLEGKGYSKDEEQAVKQYRTAANANSRVAQFKLGQCYRNGSGVEKNEADWRKWIRSAASNASGTDVQSVYTAIDFKQAAESFRVFYESLVEQNPDNIYYLNNLAFSLLISENKNPQRALEIIEKAIELAPEDFSGVANFVDTKATALKELGNTKEAAKLFESVLDELNDKKPVLESLIECFDTLDNKEKADQFRKQLSELSANSE